MARPSGESSGSAKGKGKASVAKKSRRPAANKAAAAGGGGAAGKKGKSTAAAAAKTRTKKRASDDQIDTQLKAIKGIKARLKDIVDRFDEVYPEGLDFAPNANDADLA